MLRRDLIVFALLWQAATLPAQTQRVLAGSPTCQQCSIQLEQVIAFGDRTGPGMLQEQATVAVDQRGRYYVSSNADPTIVVFDPRGRVLQRLGRRGQGPGEFRSRPIILFGPRDTLYAMELLTRRLSVFSPTYRFVRTVPLAEGGTYGVRAGDDRFLLAGVARSPEGIGYPLRTIDGKGAHVRSFGSTTGELDLYSPMESYRKVAVPRGPNVWTSRVDAYVLEQWSLDGKLLARLIRQVPWFPPGIRPTGRGPDSAPPPPRMRDLSEDDNGLVWTIATVADHEWKPRTLPMRPTRPSRYIPDSLTHKLNDSVIEVIDPARGTLLAARTFDTVFMQFIAHHLLVSFDEDADGNPRYVVWRARIVSPTTK